MPFGPIHRAVGEVPVIQGEFVQTEIRDHVVLDAPLVGGPIARPPALRAGNWRLVVPDEDFLQGLIRVFNCNAPQRSAVY